MKHLEVYEFFGRSNKDDKWNVETYGESPVMRTPYPGNTMNRSQLNSFLNSKGLSGDEYVWTFIAGQEEFYQVVTKAEFLSRLLKHISTLPNDRMKAAIEMAEQFVTRELGMGKGQRGIHIIKRVQFNR